MIVTFLGTGTSQGVPVIGCQCVVCRSLDHRDKRLRTSIHIDVDGYSIVVDPGPDFRQQMLRAGIMHLDAVIVTHEHKDHTGGLDDIRAYNFMQNMSMPIYAWPRVIEYLTNEYQYIFNSTYPGIPKINLIPIETHQFKVGPVMINALTVLHAKLPVLGLRIGAFAYITDANYIGEEEQKKLIDLDVLVLNALQQQPHISHYTLSEAMSVAKFLDPKQTYFTHMSHNIGLHKTIENQLPTSINLAYDMLKINI